MDGSSRARLFILCKETLNGEPIDIGHSMLSVGHSVAIAFNAWDGTREFTDATDKFNVESFTAWRTHSFRKIVCKVTEKEFELIKTKLKEKSIPYRLCGEIAFGPDSEIALVVFPLEVEDTPNCLKYCKKWK